MATITTLRTNTSVDAPLRDLAIDASIAGATISYNGAYNIYPIDNEFLVPEQVTAILSVPDTTVTDYKVIRWINTSDLASEIPVSIPNSSVTDENDVTRQITFQELADKPTRTVDLRADGNYWCKASAAGDCQGITLDEYNSCIADGVALLETENLPAYPAE